MHFTFQIHVTRHKLYFFLFFSFSFFFCFDGFLDENSESGIVGGLTSSFGNGTSPDLVFAAPSKFDSTLDEDVDDDPDLKLLSYKFKITFFCFCKHRWLTDINF
jgi:hypothetical protein